MSLFQVLYLVAAALFILALKWMSSPATARRGVVSGEVGMLLAVFGTLLRHEVFNYEWILIALVVGAGIGVPLAILMPMTHVPQRTAISQACGAFASALISRAPCAMPMAVCTEAQKSSKSSNVRVTVIARVATSVSPASVQRAFRASMRDASARGGSIGAKPMSRRMFSSRGRVTRSR